MANIKISNTPFQNVLKRTKVSSTVNNYVEKDIKKLEEIYLDKLSEVRDSAKIIDNIIMGDIFESIIFERINTFKGRIASIHLAELYTTAINDISAYCIKWLEKVRPIRSN